MGCSKDSGYVKLIVDSIHGDILLTEREVNVIDTPSFQHLRHLKQLAMAQMVYPTATHTRFAHSIGALGTMIRILSVAKKNGILLSDEEKENLRLASLLHDIGHYPYSHLMEELDKVILTEEIVKETKTDSKALDKQIIQYPQHEELGSLIVTQRPDLLEALGGLEQAKKVAYTFTRSVPADPQLTKLVHSSLDIDRLDYLLRDSQATGVPYGHIDINYLLNNLKVSPQGFVGFLEKALPAVEHFLLARFFIYRVVYYHKTIYGMEEACRQMLRRLRDRYSDKYDIPRDGEEVIKFVTSERLKTFTDTFVDKIIQEAVNHNGDADEDKVIRALARSIQSRRPPKLLKEVLVFEETKRTHHTGTAFMQNCEAKLGDLSDEFKIPLGQFLLCESNIPVLKRPKEMRIVDIAKLKTEDIKEDAHKEEEEDIKIFREGQKEPGSLMDIDYSIVTKFAGFTFQLFRLYVVYEGDDKDDKIAHLRDRVKNWDK